VLLALTAQKFEDWADSLFELVHDGIDDEAFLEAYQEASLRDPLMLKLSARLGDVIEHNVSIERLIESKRMC